jgi:hypothetical protein
MNEAELKAEHEALWKWLCDNPTKGKEDWPEWNDGNGLYGEILEEYNTCFACYFVYIADEFTSCEKCPLQMIKCADKKSPWKGWVHADNEEDRKKYAAIIRDAWREIPT